MLLSNEIPKAIFEMFEMTRIPRSGWQRAGVRNGIENVAEHAFLTAQIAFVLAIMEKVPSPEKVVTMALFHDNAETRIGDQNKLNARYIDKKTGERKAFKDFVSRLPESASILLCEYFDEFESGQSSCAVIVKDADLLQMAFQAKYYLSLGYKFARLFIDNIEPKLKTQSAKDIFNNLEGLDFFDWCYT